MSANGLALGRNTHLAPLHWRRGGAPSTHPMHAGATSHQWEGIHKLQLTRSAASSFRQPPSAARRHRDGASSPRHREDGLHRWGHSTRARALRARPGLPAYSRQPSERTAVPTRTPELPSLQ
ncbi:hypothetical protein NDU88_008268 [Pleurodeles waltl]|uniref:Uncharacterized protein n=1 Tax=Pleurodeles waltl TaxID=8319 RepID=A0AAV7N4I2_PLEWA|nr:hypothetical protein NDU88_008268 [Pleurodeles waltl]